MVVAPSMFQRLNSFMSFLGLYLSRKRSMALLESIEASNLSDEDRDRVTHIIRTMLRLPDDPV